MTPPLKNDIQVIDIEPFLSGSTDKQLLEKIDRICSETGLFLVTGHGIDENLIDEAYAVSKEFFNLDESTKARYCKPDGSFLGYRGLHTLQASTKRKTVPDKKEVYTIGADDRGSNGKKALEGQPWPAELPAFEGILTRYYRELNKLSLGLSRLFAQALGLPAEFFKRRSDRSVSYLVTFNFPAEGETIPGQVRFAQHRDRDLFTVLTTNAPGLEVKDRQGRWYPVPVQPHAFTVNIGSMFTQWTEGRWTAPLHGVRNATLEETHDNRQTLTFFFNPNAEVKLSPLSVEDGDNINIGAPSDGADAEPQSVSDFLSSAWDLYRIME
ncbi:isopenicillin N synthase family dioxygenase [Streptomyces sp. NPDC093595]|uniref:isopenicillin N synthase family dioxygenase n=1 Tax=Streptomyces sp. NPDC093595 TaxID=3366045 RepID=UPI00380D6223